MERWRFEITDLGEADLEKLDVSTRTRILQKLRWLVDNFEYITPIPLGEPLKGFFKLRVGDWRIIYEVNENKKVVIVHAVDIRDRIYKKSGQRGFK